jgi:hypothetical protein
LGFGFWVLGFGFWVLGFRFWVLKIKTITEFLRVRMFFTEFLNIKNRTHLHCDTSYNTVKHCDNKKKIALRFKVETLRCLKLKVEIALNF